MSDIAEGIHKARVNSKKDDLRKAGYSDCREERKDKNGFLISVINCFRHPKHKTKDRILHSAIVHTHENMTLDGENLEEHKMLSFRQFVLTEIKGRSDPQKEGSIAWKKIKKQLEKIAKLESDPNSDFNKPVMPKQQHKAKKIVDNKGNPSRWERLTARLNNKLNDPNDSSNIRIPKKIGHKGGSGKKKKT